MLKFYNLNIKEHWKAIVFAVCIGLIIFLPTLRSIEKIGLNNFKGIYQTFSDDEDYYLSLTREVYDGHNNLSNPYIKEYKTGTYLFPPLPEITYSVIAKTLNVSVATEAEINDFFLPVISFLLLYGLFWKMTRKQNISLGLSSLFFLFFISTFSRPISPQFGFPFFLLGLHLIWKIATEKYELSEIIKLNVLLALVFGLLVYVYPFYWMTLAVVYFIWTALMALTEKNFLYWARNWVSFFIPAVVFSLPFILNTLVIRSTPFFFETNQRLGFISTHIPSAFFNVFLMLICIPLVYFIWRKSQDKSIALFAPTLIVSGIVLNWQNVITGQTLQFPPHFYMIMVLFIFCLGVILLNLLDKSSFSKVILALFLVILVILGNKQKGEAIYTFKNIFYPKDITKLQNLSGPLSWLQENTPKDSSVYVLGDFNWAIPIYTHNNVYFSSNAGLSLMPDIELENRWAIQHFFDKVAEKDIQEREIWSNKFIDAYQNKESRRKILEFLTGKNYPETELMPQIYIDRIMEDLSRFKKEGFEKALKTYSVDYLLLDTNNPNYTGLDEIFKNYPFLIREVTTEGIIIYQIK